jgi:hypothetical protein
VVEANIKAAPITHLGHRLDVILRNNTSTGTHFVVVCPAKNGGVVAEVQMNGKSLKVQGRGDFVQQSSAAAQISTFDGITTYSLTLLFNFNASTDTQRPGQGVAVPFRTTKWRSKDFEFRVKPPYTEPFFS